MTTNIVKESNEIVRIAGIAGKSVKEIIPIESDGSTFSITSAYEKKVKSMGYKIGSMCRSAPRALAKEGSVDYIAKWYNIGREDYDLMDGVVLCDDNRNGKEAVIAIFE